jgi:hypothetical protein
MEAYTRASSVFVRMSECTVRRRQTVNSRIQRSQYQGLVPMYSCSGSANSQYASAKQDVSWHSRSSATKRRTHGVISDATKPLSVNTKQYRYRVFSSNGHLLKGEEEHHSNTESEVL